MIKINLLPKCPMCKGKGSLSNGTNHYKCQTCNGKGIKE